jgi:hypothetical protein
MYQFIKEHDAPFLLEQRIHNGNLKQFLADNKIDVSALAGTKEEERFFKDVENQRALGIVKAVSHRYIPSL